MQPGEIIVARLKEGATIGWCLAVDSTPTKSQRQRIRVAMGRNREARLAADRIMLATGVAASGMDEVEEFRRRCESLAAGIDLRELWEVVLDEATHMSLDELAGLYWDPSYDATQRAALLLYLHRTPLYFVNEDGSYSARSRESVQEIEARRQREAENARAAVSLMEHLSQGRPPPDITPYQSSLVEHLRGYAVHGDNYTRSAVARGLLASVEGRTGDLQRLSFELLVKAGVLAPDEPLELERAGIPQEFRPEALSEAAAIDLARALDEPQRRDLTDLLTITIDDSGTGDRDDALSLELEEPGRQPSEPTYRLGIHIADAGALIPQGGALDHEADRRMASLYMPERKVPMLPPEISSGIGSLAPGENRAALSLIARVTEPGDVVDWEVAPSVIRSDASLSYDEADAALGDASRPWHQTLASLDHIARSLRRKREDAGALNLDRLEMAIKVAESGQVDVKVLPRSSPARQMVAELMILCNSLLAEYCRREGLSAAYRSQATPDLGDLMAVVPDGPLRRYLVMRRLPPVELDTTPAFHGGLGVGAYTQATSPLRRYPDMVTQRQITRFLQSGEPLYSREAIASVAQRAEVQIRELARLEEERRRYWFLKFLDQQLATGLADTFRVVVLDSQPRRPALLELADYPFRFRAELPQSCVPGDEVTLRLHGVDLWHRTAQFVHVP